MGRRKRAQSDEYDDSIERQFFEKEKIDVGGGESQSSQKELSAEEIEQKRIKKKAKKLRQKEKKMAFIKAQDEVKEVENKRKEETKGN